MYKKQHIADAIIVNNRIVNNSITSEKIGHNAIEGRHLPNDVIESRHIGDNSVLEEHIADGQIDGSKLKDLSFILISEPTRLLSISYAVFSSQTKTMK